MLTIVSLFGRSPFAPLQSHMERVARCVHCLGKLFDALENNDYSALEVLCDKISALEHEADIIKNDIRNHLPKSLYLPIDRTQLLDILSIQDSIADKIEDIAILTTLTPLTVLDSFKSEFKVFLHKNIETFDKVQLIMRELPELVESSFGGIEAAKVCSMIEEVAYREHEVDVIQRVLLKKLFQSEAQLTYMTFSQWGRIFENIAAISNLSEKLAHRIRMVLEIK